MGKDHKISVADWAWQWAIANDPLGRQMGAGYLKDLLYQKIAECGGKPAGTAAVPELVPEEPPPPKPPLPKLWNGRPWLPHLTRRTTLVRTYGECWSLHVRQVEEYDRQERGRFAVRLDLTEKDSMTLRYRFAYGDIRWNAEGFRLWQNGGQWYYLIHADVLAAAGHNLLDTYAE